MGYQLYLLMAVIVLKYGIALRVGTPENSIAQALHTQQTVQLATMRPHTSLSITIRSIEPGLPKRRRFLFLIRRIRRIVANDKDVISECPEILKHNTIVECYGCCSRSVTARISF